MLYSPIVTILEVNTVSLRLIAFKKSDDFFRPLVTLSASYAGIDYNRFSKPDQLFTIIQNLFTELSAKIKFLPSKVYVLLPQTFFHTFISESDITVNRQVKAQDIIALCKKCSCNDPDYAIIDYTPISFKTLNYPVMFNPIGQECDKLYGKISSVCLEKRIKEFFDTLAKGLKKSFVYVGESNACIDKVERDFHLPSAIRLLVNIRDEHISVNLCKGRAILASATVEWGANHIYYALQDLLKINLPMAKLLVSKLNLNVNCTPNDSYLLNDGDNLMEYNMGAINKRVIDTLDFIADNIKKAVTSFKLESALPVYITGSDVCTVRGVKDIMNNAIGGEMIDILLPSRVNYDTASDFVLVSLLEKINNASNTDFAQKFITKPGRI